MTWSLKGQLYESCSCNMFCPCWFGVQDLMIMDQGWCSGLLGFRVHEGSSDGLSLNDREIVLAVHWPGPTLFDADGTARLSLDDGVDDDQHAELESIFQGRKGGPMAVIDSLVSAWLPTQRARIEVTEDGDTVSLAVEGAGDVRSTLLRDPGGTSFTLRGGGFITGLGLEEAELAPSGSRWADAEMPHGFETKSGARGHFAWAG
ncbi:DUF1326 domain-containing protein [Streptomyces sp. NRRL S-118]|uniref:DUF1326 domain-containing protein n=1 Tax=Streptomyces sp. NRRL S-118 TaxID=1463881 RepID=UPI0004C64B0C|nr:DUF1326 domain-containing protein [Streptomyces sp. NRRL S-118]